MRFYNRQMISASHENFLVDKNRPVVECTKLIFSSKVLDSIQLWQGRKFLILSKYNNYKLVLTFRQILKKKMRSASHKIHNEEENFCV